MKRSFKSMGLAVAIVAATWTTGCAIRISEPARVVAHDYTDFEEYDRPHAPSPRYDETEAAPRNAAAASTAALFAVTR